MNFLRKPTVYPIATTGRNNHCIVARTLQNDDGSIQVQALNTEGEWENRPEGFEADVAVRIPLKTSYVGPSDYTNDDPELQADIRAMIDSAIGANDPLIGRPAIDIDTVHKRAMADFGRFYELKRPSLWTRFLKLVGVR